MLKVQRCIYSILLFQPSAQQSLGAINPNVLISAALQPHHSQPVKCHHCTNTLWPHRAATQQNNAASAEYEQKNCTNIQTLKPSRVIGGMGKQEEDRKESGAIVEWPCRLSLWQGHYWTQGTHTQSQTQSHRDRWSSPAGPVGEHYVAFLVRLLNESYARLFLPVTHGLFKHGPLTAWNTHILHPTFTQSHSVCVLLLSSTGTGPAELLTSEVSSYDVGDDSSGPYPLSPGCGRSRNTALCDARASSNFPSLTLRAGSSLAGILGEII